tara:strand:- start:1536 stop:1673 length:138 start_codon:yes stop_codon:yes gene_type:complete
VDNLEYSKKKIIITAKNVLNISQKKISQRKIKKMVGKDVIVVMGL